VTTTKNNNNVRTRTRSSGREAGGSGRRTRRCGRMRAGLDAARRTETLWVCLCLVRRSGSRSYCMTVRREFGRDSESRGKCAGRRRGQLASRAGTAGEGASGECGDTGRQRRRWWRRKGGVAGW